MTEDRSLVNEFIAESREHLSGMEKDFIQLEKQRDNPEKELVNRIFRAVHTIKGSAGFFGLKNITGLSHAMETLLALLRDGSLNPGQDCMDLLLKGVDALSALLDDIEVSDQKDVSSLITGLQALIENQASPESKKELHAQVPVKPPEGSQGSFDINQFDLKSLSKEKRHLYILSYDLARLEKEKGKSPVSLVKQLLQTGNILDGILSGPSADLRKGVPGPGLTYHVLYATVLDQDIIDYAVELDRSKILKLDPRSLKGDKEQPVKPAEPAPPATPAAPAASPAPEKGETVPGGAETVRIRLDILDRLMMLAGELVLVRNRQVMHVDPSDALSRSIAARLNLVTTDLQETIMRTRMQPIGNIFGKFTRIVRDLGKKLSKNIEIEMTGNEVELDKTILETLTDPLTHIIRNCCDHGIETPQERIEQGKKETGLIRLKAFHEGGQMNVEISDDGKGIDVAAIRKKAVEKKLKSQEEVSRMGEKEALQLMFLPGLSTAKEVSDLSGRGVGMDVVKTGIEKLGGVVEIKTAIGKGTRMNLRLPLTLAIIPSLIVKAGEYRYAIPQINLVELVCLYDDDVKNKVECAGSREVYRLRDRLLPLLRLNEIFNHPEPLTETASASITEKARRKILSEQGPRSLTFAVLKAGNLWYGLIIDGVLGTEEIVVKPMHRSVKDLILYSGATVLGDGSVALILDALGLSRHAGLIAEEEEKKGGKEDRTQAAREEGAKRQSLLIFKSGKNEQFAVPSARIKRIEKIKASAVEKTGDREFVTVDGESTRVLRLDERLKVSPCLLKDEMFLLLPKKSDRAFGVMVSELMDIGDYDVQLNRDAYREAGLDGSAIVKGRMTLFPDFEALAIEKGDA